MWPYIVVGYAQYCSISIRGKYHLHSRGRSKGRPELRCRWTDERTRDECATYLVDFASYLGMKLIDVNVCPLFLLLFCWCLCQISDARLMYRVMIRQRPAGSGSRLLLLLLLALEAEKGNESRRVLVHSPLLLLLLQEAKLSCLMSDRQAGLHLRLLLLPHRYLYRQRMICASSCFAGCSPSLSLWPQ